MEIQRYKSIRKVRAFRIAGIENGKLFNSADEGIKPVDPEFFRRHQPYVGAWFVLYDNGYQSICPDESFRDGYVAIDENAEEVAAGVPTAEVASESDVPAGDAVALAAGETA